MTQTPKTYAVPAEGLPLMKEYRRVMEAMHSDIAAIQENAQKEAERVHGEHLDSLKRLWYQLAPMVGIDAAATWDDGLWGVDTRYVEHGFGAINQAPRPPTAPWMPKAAEEEGPPPGTALN